MACVTIYHNWHMISQTGLGLMTDYTIWSLVKSECVTPVTPLKDLFLARWGSDFPKTNRLQIYR
jgi:hypothetical protein